MIDKTVSGHAVLMEPTPPGTPMPHRPILSRNEQTVEAFFESFNEPVSNPSFTSMMVPHVVPSMNHSNGWHQHRGHQVTIHPSAAAAHESSLSRSSLPSIFETLPREVIGNIPQRPLPPIRMHSIPYSAPQRSPSSPRNNSIQKSFKCPRPYCMKVYKNANGLKYHMEKGTCEIEAHEANDAVHANALQQGAIKCAIRPYWCRVCGQKYKNLNGLKYHAKVTHPELHFHKDIKGHHAHMLE
jgi:hypothetical protein